MIRATFCCYDKPGIVGGTTSWIQWLLPELRRREVDARCLVFLHTGADGPVVEDLQRAGVPCTTRSMEGYAEDRVRWILDTVKKDPCDVFIPNEVPSAYHASRWIRAAGIPTIGVLHTDGEASEASQELFVRSTKPDAVTAMVCVSKELESRLSRLPHPDTLIARIPCGADVPSVTARQPGRGPLRMAFVGRLADDPKRVSDIARAMVKTVAQVPQTEGVIWGDGPQRADVAAILRNSEDHRVVLADRLDPAAVQPSLLNCHVIVLLSDYEGLPISLMEAMACGCVPVCVQMRSGIPELVEHNITGLIIPDRNEGFVAAIRRLRDDPILWERLSAAARSRIQGEYSHERCGAMWAALLEEVASAASPSSFRIPRRIRLPAVVKSLESGIDRKPGGFQSTVIDTVSSFRTRIATRFIR